MEPWVFWLSASIMFILFFVMGVAVAFWYVRIVDKDFPKKMLEHRKKRLEKAMRDIDEEKEESLPPPP